MLIVKLIYGEKIYENKNKIKFIRPFFDILITYDTKNDWISGYNGTVDQDRRLVNFISIHKKIQNSKKIDHKILFSFSGISINIEGFESFKGSRFFRDNECIWDRPFRILSIRVFGIVLWRQQSLLDQWYIIQFDAIFRII
jgi:hypothetical protein